MQEAMGNLKRTNYCGDLRENDIDSEVILMGWVQRGEKSRLNNFYRFKR
ncbi:hypothetical protein HMPREF9131_1005 [Peptoniphilus sp. oral taxon 836 str. F0141]|nr:hypothetical protein HMPREF9131_1005 [Peptoniphilus sp. oral taxon 836 str. F0141]